MILEDVAGSPTLVGFEGRSFPADGVITNAHSRLQTTATRLKTIGCTVPSSGG